MYTDRKIAVLGLGYVGLPVAISLGAKWSHVLGYDIDSRKVSLLNKGVDETGEVDVSKLSRIKISDKEADLSLCDFFIITVPTPVDDAKSPDLSPVVSAARCVGRHIKKGGIVVLESTVYPGVTEEILGPTIEQVSGLKCGVDFKLGYSPERINPGDKVRTFETITKVVSGQDAESLEVIARVYGSVVEAGIHKAPSIKVAEAAKVIENTQRDLNIALMNELSLIFDLIGINTSDVLAAAGTKWNFLKFTPGLVGGHCIGVDPYYLTRKAEMLGYHPDVILAGRRVNDEMAKRVAHKTIKLMSLKGIAPFGARIGIMGLTFKENVPDIRNSKVPDIIKELESFGVKCLVCDPYASPEAARHEYGIEVVSPSELSKLSALILAVSHKEFVEVGEESLCSRIEENGIFVDVKSALDRTKLRSDITYWSL